MQAHDFAMRLEPSASRSISPALAATTRGGIVVFSGGSAANNLVDVFNDIREANNAALSYVIPISDNGGSSSEIIRVFGGPGRCTTHHHHHLTNSSPAHPTDRTTGSLD